MKRPLIAANWKMYKTIPEALNVVASIKAGIHRAIECQVVICPSFTALSAVGQLLKESSIDLGAQDIHPETEGAFTGEISPLMLKDVGCRFVIVGHSERRHLFHETNEFINRKVRAALKFSLIPIVCMGETLEEREAKKAFEAVKVQFDGSLKDLSPDDIQRVVIAYEPVWAIGTGRTASPEQAEQMHSYIRRLLHEKYGEENTSHVLILYGGSVRPDNMASLMQKPNVDGALVGGASLKAESFTQIVLNSIQTESGVEGG